MSLISQRDREVAITALEHYIENIKRFESYHPEADNLMEFHALLNWIKLEYSKNEN